MRDETAERPASTPTDSTAEPDSHLSPPLPAGTLVYDGDCGFCTATARWVQRRLSDEYRVIPSQRADLDALGLTEHDVARSAWWIGHDGTRWDEHLSIAGALSAMSGPWPTVGRFLSAGLISPLARFTYRLVADNRYRIRRPGTPSSCNR